MCGTFARRETTIVGFELRMAASFAVRKPKSRRTSEATLNTIHLSAAVFSHFEYNAMLMDIAGRSAIRGAPRAPLLPNRSHVTTPSIAVTSSFLNHQKSKKTMIAVLGLHVTKFP